MPRQNLMVSKDVVLAIGLGSFGRELCRILTERGVSVVAVDKSAEALSQVSGGVGQTVQAGSTVESSLRAALFGHVKAAIVAIGEDTEAAILTTSLLSDFEVPYILARASSQLHMRVLSRVGADEVVNLEIEEGRRIAARLASLDIRETIPIKERHSLLETGVPRGFAGKSIRELHLPK
jgi:trk system potassium uptake protein TrkA